jgi:hypothetical protein
MCTAAVVGHVALGMLGMLYKGHGYNACGVAGFDASWVRHESHHESRHEYRHESPMDLSMKYEFGNGFGHEFCHEFVHEFGN